MLRLRRLKPGAGQQIPGTFRLYVEVEDTGVGIAPEELDSLFDAFVQTESGRMLQQGSGLGLPLSYQFVRMMGGELRVCSTCHSAISSIEEAAQSGTCFQFDVPARTVDVSDIDPMSSLRQVIGLQPGQPAHRLLVVGDDPISRKLLVKRLRGLGFDAREAGDKEEALEIWMAWHPHLIWVDTWLPSPDSYELARHIKKACNDAALRSPSILIALTDSIREEDHAAILDAGYDGLQHKPIGEPGICAVLEDYLDVQFIYEEQDGIVESVRDNPTLAAHHFEGEVLCPFLPPDLLTDIEGAAIRTNITLLTELTDKVRAYDPALADMLTGLVRNFEYARILALVQEVRK